MQPIQDDVVRSCEPLGALHEPPPRPELNMPSLLLLLVQIRINPISRFDSQRFQSHRLRYPPHKWLGEIGAAGKARKIPIAAFYVFPSEEEEVVGSGRGEQLAQFGTEAHVEDDVGGKVDAEVGEIEVLLCEVAGLNVAHGDGVERVGEGGKNGTRFGDLVFVAELEGLGEDVGADGGEVLVKGEGRVGGRREDTDEGRKVQVSMSSMRGQRIRRKLGEDFGAGAKARARGLKGREAHPHHM